MTLVSEIVQSPVLPAIVGAITGTALSFGVQKWNRIQEVKDEREYLRRSILAELASMESLARLEAARYHTQLRVSLETPSIIYEANSSRLSLLSKDEVKSIVEFYSSSGSVKEKMDRTWDILEQAETKSNIDFSPINNSIADLREQWESAVLSIMTSLDEYPDTIIVDGEEHHIRALNSADLWTILNNDLSDTNLQKEANN